ncbi:hypothetical protein [Paraburkholderia sp. GAS348]|jgi:uncharacterized protein YoaH (UPF0181 family)|uniref:hypothetical protein n=1 Tax=Paraburkholderia sp. GAS348 TaxID=3035132 RepID=UPI003D231942
MAITGFSPNQGAQGILTGSGLSTGAVFAVMAAKIQKDAGNVKQAMNEVNDSNNTQQGAGAGNTQNGTDNSQDNLKMAKLQQATTVMNTDINILTTTMAGMGEAQQSVAKNIR